MADAFESLWCLGMNFSRESEWAWHLGDCPHCAGSQMVVVARTTSNPLVQWMRCVSCSRGAVLNDGVPSPGARPLRLPAGVPPIEAGVWEEVRNCLSVGANTAAVMLCRKLLVHVAVGQGMAEQNDKGKSPTFAEAVDYLEGEGVVTRKMRPWVDRIREVGNEANHEIPSIPPEVALDVATFTEQLLRLAYEMSVLMGDPPPTATD